MISWDVTHPYDADRDHLRLHYRLAADGDVELPLQAGAYVVRADAGDRSWMVEMDAVIREGETSALDLTVIDEQCAW